MRAPRILITFIATLIAFTAWSPETLAGTQEARDAIDELQSEQGNRNVVQNRFFVKTGRFELAPVLGIVPNNPFVKRFVGGTLMAYHFSEAIALEGAFMYSPDLGGQDLKDLTHTLVNIAEQGSGEVNFQQPLDKMIMGATFAARWAPVYGKINLIGERVLNFDLYGTAGIGMLAVNKYYASYDSASETGTSIPDQPVEKKTEVPINLGIGLDFFFSNSLALKIDARDYFYVDEKPQYDPDTPQTEKRLYNNFIASVGFGVYFPKMQERRYDF